jgi:glycine cleavage system aminomethyltransferase T
LLVDGADVGLVTQAVAAPCLDGQTLGLAKIRKDLSVPGTAVIARVGGSDVAGEVVEHPVYEKERRKAKES